MFIVVSASVQLLGLEVSISLVGRACTTWTVEAEMRQLLTVF